MAASRHVSVLDDQGGETTTRFRAKKSQPAVATLGEQASQSAKAKRKTARPQEPSAKPKMMKSPAGIIRIWVQRTKSLLADNLIVSGRMMLSAGMIASLLAFLASLDSNLTLWGRICISAGFGLATGLTGWCLARLMKGSNARSPSVGIRRTSSVDERAIDEDWEQSETAEIHNLLAEALGDLVIHRSRRGDVLFSNSRFDSYFDSTTNLPRFEASISGKPKTKKEAAQTVVYKTREIEVETLKGKRWFEWTDLVVRDPVSGELGCRSIGRDMTKKRENELALNEALTKAEHANKAKSRFLAMVSHEIRTPLNGVIGMANLLRDTSLDPAQKSYVQAIDKSGQALLSLIEDLLDTARIEAGQMTLQMRDADLSELLENVAEIVAPRAREKGLDLATYLDPALPDTLHTDSGRLRQILLNLVGNAVKFTEQGGISIRFEHRASESGSCNLIISVIDTGPGLSQSDQKTIFRDFSQASTGASRAHEGAGLGLSISRQIAALMHSRIDVVSQVGKGATFNLTIPLSDHATITPSKKKSIKKRSKDHSVLLIMNDTPARDAMADAMTDLGYIVEAAASPTIDDGFVAKGPEIIVADRLLVEEFPFLKDGDALPDALKQAKIIGLGDPGTSGSDEGIFDGWLTWPVRRETMQHVLDGSVGKVEKSFSKLRPTPVANNKMRILLAEDNPINAMLVKALIGKIGHKVDHVENGKESLTAVKNLSSEGGQYDLVLMDLHMPVMDGCTAIKAIRLMSDQTLNIPIYVLSADGQTSAREEAMNAGADGFLIKPLDIDKVSALISKVAETKIAV